MISKIEKNKQSRFKKLMKLLLSLLILLFFLHLFYGSVSIFQTAVWNEIISSIQGTTTPSPYLSILFEIRLPRVLGAFLIGAILSVSGLLLQVFFRNPLVGPQILGVGSGAQLFMAGIFLANLQLGLDESPYFLLLASFLGSFSVLFLILLISYRVANPVYLLLIGLMFAYFTGAVSSFLMAFAQKEELYPFVLWTLGSLSKISQGKLLLLSSLGIPLILIAFLLTKDLNSLSLGEEYAMSLGVSVRNLRVLLFFISGSLVALSTSVSGPVAFIGLAVPHMARFLMNSSDIRFLLPSVVLLGAFLTALCDFLAKNLYAPIEIPLSALTSIFGAPLVIFLLFKKKSDLL